MSGTWRPCAAAAGTTPPRHQLDRPAVHLDTALPPRSEHPRHVAMYALVSADPLEAMRMLSTTTTAPQLVVVVVLDGCCSRCLSAPTWRLVGTPPNKTGGSRSSPIGSTSSPGTA